MHNLNLFSDDDISKNGKERKNSGESCFSIDDKEWDVIDFESIGQISHARPAFVGVGNNYDFVTAVDEFGGELIDVTFDATGLGIEKVADHGYVVRHLENCSHRSIWATVTRSGDI